MAPASAPGAPSVAAVCVGAMALALLFTGLDETSLPSFDDAYHAQTAKEMLRRGDPITITYAGQPSFQSSPLPAWLMAGAFAAFGVNEYAARLPSAALALATIAMTYLFARRRWGEDAGVAAAFVLCTSVLFLRYSRHAMAEVPLAFFFTAAVLAFVQARKREAAGWYSLFGLMCGLAILTKSALGALPLAIAVAFFIATGQAGRILRPRFLLSLLVAGAVACAWYLPALLKHGGFFIESHIGSYLAVHALAGHHAGLGFWGLFYYLVWFPVHFLPWTLALLPCLLWGFGRWRGSSAVPALWLAIVLPVALLSLGSSKYTRYLVPLLPAAALLIAALWVPRLGPRLRRRFVAGVAILCAVVAAAVIALPVSMGEDRNADIKALAPEIAGLVAPGGAVGNFRLSFFKYQNPLLFYADRRLALPSQTPEQLFASVAEGLGLASRPDYAELVESAGRRLELRVEAEAGQLVLFRWRTARTGQ